MMLGDSPDVPHTLPLITQGISQAEGFALALAFPLALALAFALAVASWVLFARRGRLVGLACFGKTVLAEKAGIGSGGWKSKRRFINQFHMKDPYHGRPRT